MTAQHTPTHHPCCDTLLRYAAGTLSPAMHILVASHLSYCPQCRQELQAYESQAGLGLEALPPEALDHHCLENLLTKINESGPPACIDVTIPINAPTHRYPEPLLPHIGKAAERIVWETVAGNAQWILPTLSASRLLKIAGQTELRSLVFEKNSVLLVLDGTFDDFHKGDIIRTRELKNLGAKTSGETLCLVVVPTCSDTPNWLQCLMSFIFGDRK